MSTLSAAPPKQHVTSTPGVCGGKPCVAGTRIRVWDVAVLAQAGCSPDEILESYPSLTLSDVHGALAYYYDNRAAIDAQAAADAQYADQLRDQLGPGPLERALSSESHPHKK